MQANSPPLDYTPPPPPPSGIQCEICGRLFGKNSIKIHEKQCLKKWHLMNDHLPPNEREPFAVRKFSLDRPIKTKETSDETKSQEPMVSKSGVIGTPDSPLFPCYLCGELFTVHEIYEHEPECLKAWRAENEKLPPEKRKKEPQKPDVKWTPSGGVDFKETFNRIWDNHLNELVECRKCHRKFFPDRIEKHESACKGLGIEKKQKK